MSFLTKWRLLALAAPVAALFFFASANTTQAGERYRSGQDAVVVRPRAGIGHGPTGILEKNPYDLRKWWRNESGMIDAINRDHPPVYPRR